MDTIFKYLIVSIIIAPSFFQCFISYFKIVRKIKFFYKQTTQSNEELAQDEQQNQTQVNNNSNNNNHNINNKNNQITQRQICFQKFQSVENTIEHNQFFEDTQLDSQSPLLNAYDKSFYQTATKLNRQNNNFFFFPHIFNYVSEQPQHQNFLNNQQKLKNFISNQNSIQIIYLLVDIRQEEEKILLLVDCLKKNIKYPNNIRAKRPIKQFIQNLKQQTEQFENYVPIQIEGDSKNDADIQDLIELMIAIYAKFRAEQQNN